jgi:nicotinamidase-related amidase
MSNGTALLIIDAQANMFATGASVYEGETMLKTLDALIGRARSAGVLVVFIQNNGKKGEPDQLGTAGWQIHPALPIQAGDLVLQKSSPDAFHLTPLQKELTRREIKRLFIAGMQTDSSVDATCRRAANLDYQVTLVSDGHSTHDSAEFQAQELIARYNNSLSALVRVADSAHIEFQQSQRQRRN